MLNNFYIEVPINENVLSLIYLNKLTLSSYTLLYSFYIKRYSESKNHIKWKRHDFENLRRHKFIHESRNHILKEGIDFINDIIGLSRKEKIQLEDDKTGFKEFWNLYPLTDEHSNFHMTTTIRGDENLTKEEYLKALKKVSKEDLLEALKWEIKMRTKPGSENKLKYLKRPKNWLKMEQYNIYLDYKSKIEEKELNNQNSAEDYGKNVV